MCRKRRPSGKGMPVKKREILHYKLSLQTLPNPQRYPAEWLLPRSALHFNKKEEKRKRRNKNSHLLCFSSSQTNPQKPMKTQPAPISAGQGSMKLLIKQSATIEVGRASDCPTLGGGGVNIVRRGGELIHHIVLFQDPPSVTQCYQYDHAC